MSKYDDIINLKRPESRHMPMSITNRAAQFAPFSALTGYDEAIKETSRITSEKHELSDGKIEFINTKLNEIKSNIQLNKKVVILDTDARKPSIHKKVKISNNTGCMDVLLETHTINDVVIHYNNFLDVIPSGAKVKNPSELFSTPAFDKLLTDLQERYDFVILDTPPINVVSDTLIIAQKVDALVMVIRAGVTKYEAFEYAYDSLKVLDIELDGIIINGSSGKSGYYSKNKFRYYRYENQQNLNK